MLATNSSFADEQKREAVIALASRKAPAQEVADAVGVTRAVLCKWKNQLLGEEAPCKMEAAPKDMADDVDALKSQAAELQEQIKRLELRKAILEGAVELLGKGRGVDPGMLTNREKALIANSLRPARRLNEILAELGMSRSSCQCQVEAMSRPDKHAGLGKRISEIFAAGDGRYGYRRIRLDCVSSRPRRQNRRYDFDSFGVSTPTALPIPLICRASRHAPSSCSRLRTQLTSRDA